MARPHRRADRRARRAGALVRPPIREHFRRALRGGRRRCAPRRARRAARFGAGAGPPLSRVSRARGTAPHRAGSGRPLGAPRLAGAAREWARARARPRPGAAVPGRAAREVRRGVPARGRRARSAGGSRRPPLPERLRDPHSATGHGRRRPAVAEAHLTREATMKKQLMFAGPAALDAVERMFEADAPAHYEPVVSRALYATRARRDTRNLIVGLDIGTSKVVALVADLLADGRFEIIGMGSHESKGLKKG